MFKRNWDDNNEWKNLMDVKIACTQFNDIEVFMFVFFLCTFELYHLIHRRRKQGDAFAFAWILHFFISACVFHFLRPTFWIDMFSWFTLLFIGALAFRLCECNWSPNDAEGEKQTTSSKRRSLYNFNLERCLMQATPIESIWKRKTNLGRMAEFNNIPILS